MSVTCAIEGLVGEVALGGTLVAWLMGVTLTATRAQTQIRAMGTYDATCILKGIRNWEGSVQRAFLCAEWVDLFLLNNTEFSGTFYPRGTAACGTIAGSLAFKGYSLDGWEAESEAAKMENLDFDFYVVTTP